jgi:hypothetical protein
LSHSGELAGFAADCVVSVALLDGSGQILETAPLTDNHFAGGPLSASGVTIESLDAQGKVIARQSICNSAAC